MKCINQLDTWQSIRNGFLKQQTIGFIPTMSSLHEGHAALIEQAKSENEVVVLSIFVNPIQFNDPKDYQQYPRNWEADIKLAERLGVDYVLAPNSKDMYPKGKSFSIETTHAMANIFEGKCRPGHFAGVLTVVMKLLQLVKPTHAYFGEKDYQQSILVQALVEDFFLPVNIIICPTMREPSGLPYSSRNSLLTKTQKTIAIHAFKLLKNVTLENTEQIHIEFEEMGIAVEYLDCHNDRVFSAIHIGDIRLIDNFKIGKQTILITCIKSNFFKITDAYKLRLYK